jgi:hypothetical protein
VKRRTLLRWIASAAAAWPLARLHVHAQGAELTPAQILTLRDVAQTVLPSALGASGVDQAVDAFLRWLRDYRAGVPLSHGYGHPELVLSGPSPSPAYARQLDALFEAARARGGRFGALPLETRRALLDEALTAAGARNLPGRPSGAHVVSDLMAHYFRSSAAWDLCYNARIGRNTFRAIAVTTVRPRPFSG